MFGKKNATLIEVLKGIGFLAGAFAFVAISAWILTAIQKHEGVSPVATPTVVEPSTAPYEVKDKMKSFVVIDESTPHSNFVEKVIGGRNKPVLNFTKRFVVHGTVVGGYIYAVGNADGKKFQSNDRFTDDLHIALSDLGKGTTEQGGLVTDRSEDVPQHQDKTELLFPLSGIPVIKDYQKPNENPELFNWLPDFSDGKKLQIDTFVGTYATKGTIEKLVIYYECLENTSCSIEAL